MTWVLSETGLITKGAIALALLICILEIAAKTMMTRTKKVVVRLIEKLQTVNLDFVCSKLEETSGPCEFIIEWSECLDGYSGMEIRSE